MAVLKSVLGFIVKVIFGVVFVGFPILMWLVMLCSAVIDFVFLGRFGVSFIGSTVIALGIDYLVRKKWPQWHAANCTFEGHSFLVMLLWIAAQFALSCLLKNVLPDMADETLRVGEAVAGALNAIPFFQDSCTDTCPCTPTP